MQATQTAQFMLMPSILLSGFMFPFRSMPQGAQWVGELLPTPHAMRIVRGNMLKGNGWPEIVPNLRPLALFMFVVIAIAVSFHRETLDRLKG
jgi:ABC-2 type transport system permease protein